MTEQELDILVCTMCPFSEFCTDNDTCFADRTWREDTRQRLRHTDKETLQRLYRCMQDELNEER